MNKKKWRDLAMRRKLLLDAYKGMMGYWKEIAGQYRDAVQSRALYGLVLDGAELELEDARRWSKAWKASAKRNRARVRALDALMRAGERLMAGELVMARTAKDQYKHRVKELERLMAEGVGLSPHLGEGEGHVINPLFVAEHVGE